MTVYLNGLATALPPYELPQDLVQQTAQRILGPRYSQFERMSASFVNSGVEKRYSFAPFEWFEEPKNWAERNAVYLSGGKDLFIKAAQAALDDAGLRADQIDTVVTVSSTGIATPTFEAVAFKELGFRQDVHRVPVFGLGCAGGVSGLAIAQTHARATPDSHVLIVALEACTLSFRSDRLQKADIIATVLFGDGAAAACLSTEQLGASVELGIGQEYLWPDTLAIMGWDVDPNGLGVIFDRSIPTFAEEHLAQAVDDVLNRAGFRRDQIDRFVCHPGGAKVVDAIETALDLPTDSLDAERTVLRDYGNMSAPTALFVLKRVLDGGQKGQLMLSALGPGFTASFLPVKVT